MHNELAQGWDRHSETYGQLFAPLTGYISHSMVRMTAKHLPEGSAVLDIACGTGAVTLAVLKHMLAEQALGKRPGRIVASDFSPGMVASTRRAVQQLHGEELVSCEVHNGEALQLEDAQFDAVFSAFGIFLFNDRRAGWREAARVLRPGGLFATAVWRGAEHNPMLRAQLAPMIQSLPPRFQRPPPPGHWTEIADRDGLLREITDAAPFVDPLVCEFQASLVLPDARTAWNAMKDNPVMGDLLRQCSPEELSPVEHAVQSHLSSLAGGADRPVVLDSVCHLFVARKAH